MEIIFDVNNIAAAAHQFAKAIADYKIVAFTGDLGAGKTTFIDAVCKEWKVTDTVSSPTYSLIQEYQTKDQQTIYHMDLYRIESLEEAIDAGVEDCLRSGNICMIEWPSIIESILEDQIVKCELSVINKEQRKLVVQLP